MSDLGSYLNVYNTALVILERKGWSLRYEKTDELWFANKDGWNLVADNPIELLGLVAIFEHHAPKKKTEYWWKIDKPNLVEKLEQET